MPKEQDLSGYRILVIEDEYFIADALRRCLAENGAEVIGPFGNLDNALKQIGRDGFELALLDINLRGFAVYPIAEALQRQKIPFIFVSGYSRTDLPERFAGVPFWEKPFEERDLVRDVKRLCKASRQYLH